MNVVCDTPAQLAQMAEHETFNLRVVGSTPALGNTFSSTTHFHFIEPLIVIKKRALLPTSLPQRPLFSLPGVGFEPTL